ncbi:unnamed protein product [marine sediment metagenome]|uniref:Uncharacterized protein n=1 Tax=marine sediment metagenome TaxID=412755 RepID=X1THU1_9ZZZZ
MLIIETTDIAETMVTTAETNPTLRIHSADATNDAEHIKFNHDQTDGVISIGQGNLKLFSAGGGYPPKGAYTSYIHKAEDLTCAGGGSATLTTSGLVPAGAVLKGVTTRITTALTGSTGFDIGISAGDLDAFGVQTAATQGALTNGTTIPYTAVWDPIRIAATEVIVTFNGGNCTAGVVLVVGHYETVTAPTAN